MLWVNYRPQFEVSVCFNEIAPMILQISFLYLKYFCATQSNLSPLKIWPSFCEHGSNHKKLDNTFFRHFYSFSNCRCRFWSAWSTPPIIHCKLQHFWSGEFSLEAIFQGSFYHSRFFRSSYWWLAHLLCFVICQLLCYLFNWNWYFPH